MKEERKEERREEIINICLDCFIENGMNTTTRTLSSAINMQSGGVYYYFNSKTELVTACAEEAIRRIENRAFGFVLKNVSDVEKTLNSLGNMADELSPTMRFLVSVCVSEEYGDLVKPALSQLAKRYVDYTKQIAELLGCDENTVRPYVHLCILALNNYMIFAERALFDPHIEAAKSAFLNIVENNRLKNVHINYREVQNA